MVDSVSKVSSGISVLDELLKGGLENDVITTIYGPSGSGKTNIFLITAINFALQDKKVIFMDSEGGFSVERIKQITDNYEKALDNIFLLKPTNFEEQKKAFEKLKEHIDNNVSLIVIDTISMHYRAELGKNSEIPYTNRELGMQISYLIEIARKKNIPILVGNQVYSDFGNKEKVNMVGGDILRYGSKCLIELQNFHSSLRKAILKKHRHIPEGAQTFFKITEKGLEKEIR